MACGLPILDKNKAVPTYHIILEKQSAPLILNKDKAVSTYFIIFEEHAAPLIIDKDKETPNYRIIHEWHMAPLILDKDKVVPTYHNILVEKYKYSADLKKKCVDTNLVFPNSFFLIQLDIKNQKCLKIKFCLLIKDILPEVVSNLLIFMTAFSIVLYRNQYHTKSLPS